MVKRVYNIKVDELGNCTTLDGSPLRPVIGSKGHLVVKNGYYVHQVKRAVAMAFLRPLPPGLFKEWRVQCIDGNENNCAWSNLRWRHTKEVLTNTNKIIRVVYSSGHVAFNKPIRAPHSGYISIIPELLNNYSIREEAAKSGYSYAKYCELFNLRYYRPKCFIEPAYFVIPYKTYIS